MLGWLGRLLVLAVLLVAFVGCQMDGADGEKDDDIASGGRGKAKSAKPGPAPAPPLPGCSAEASCSDRATDGGFCRPACDVACRKTHSHYSFWVSTYDVDGTGGLGRHQGISVLGVELSYDDRVDAGDHAWPAPAVPQLPPDIGQKMTDDGRFRQFAMCSAPSVVVDVPLYNHGRTMSRDPAHAANRVELHSAHVDTDGAAVTAAATTKSCLTAIKDGHCDAVCGNCSYVLPAVAVEPIRHDDWSKPSDLVGGTGQCSTGGGYYGGPGKQSQDTFRGNPFPNPFTHCSKLGCGAQDEAPSISSIWQSDSAVITGRFGHNSNADAEAEFRAFSACVSPGEFDAASACAACGTGHAPNRQDPCTDETNTASTWWDRTADLTKDFSPVIKGDEGDHAPAPPQCAWGNFPVLGM